MSMRKWEEIQEMSRRCLTLAVIALGICAAAPKPALPPAKDAAAAPAAKPSAIWPEKLGTLTRDSVQSAAAPADGALWEEYGFDTAEQAVYSGSGRKITGTAYRMKDPTGAVSAYQLLLPPDARKAKLADYSVN